MIDLMKRLAELDAQNPNIVSEVSKELATKAYNKMSVGDNPWKNRTGLAGDQSDRMKAKMDKRWGKDEVDATVQKSREQDTAEGSFINGQQQSDDELVWKQTSLSMADAVAKFGKENVKIDGKNRLGEPIVAVKAPLVSKEEDVAEGPGFGPFDPDETLKAAMPLMDKLREFTSGQVDYDYNKDGSIHIVVNRRDDNPRLGWAPKKGDAFAADWRENFNNAYTPFFNAFRQKGWYFSQPRYNAMDVGVPAQQGVAEGSGPKEKQHDKYVDRSSPESKAKVQAAKNKMASDKAAEPGKKLADKIAKKDVAESLEECGTMGGMSHPHSPASINMTAATGEELSAMLKDIMTLAGRPMQEPMGDQPVGGADSVAVVDVEPSSEPTMGDDEPSIMRSMLDKLNPGDDQEEKTDEMYDNSPDEAIAGPEAAVPSGNDLHKEKGQYPAAQRGDNAMAAFENLMAEYKNFIKEN